jgi:hypothetical protein
MKTSLDLPWKAFAPSDFPRVMCAVFRKLKNAGAVEEESTAEQLIRMALKELKRN